MRKKKPVLLLYSELIKPLENLSTEIQTILSEIDNIKEPYLLKGLFAYIFGLFESSLGECFKIYLVAYPKEIKVENDTFKEHGYIIDTIFTSEVLELMADDYVSKLSYGNLKKFLDIFQEKISIKIDIANYSDLNEKKERRNILMHNNLVIDKKYIKNTKSDPRERGNKLEITKEYLNESLLLIKDITMKFTEAIQSKYSMYTRLKLFRDVWEYLFDSEVMLFDDYWTVKRDGDFQFNEKGWDKYVKVLSSGERTILAYILQNFSPSICDEYFKFNDMNMQVGNPEMMAYIVDVFDRYPYLAQPECNFNFE